MRYAEIITEGRDAGLFHGYSDPEWASLALSKNEMAATTTQRFWPDGKRRKDNDPEYEGSYWMKGISLTRDRMFSMQWGQVVFEIDQSRLNQRYKVIPFNWGFSIPDRPQGMDPQHHKREREEFVVVKATKDTYRRENGSLDMNRFRGPEGAVKPLSTLLKGIYVSISLLRGNAYEDKKMTANGTSIQQMIDHPLFKGYYVWGRHADGKLIPPDAIDDYFEKLRAGDDQ